MQVTQRLSETLEAIIANRIAKDTLKLPVMPSTALAALELIRDPTASVSRITAAIGNDPMLALQVIRAASSPALGGNGAVKTLGQAVVRLGVHRLKPLVIEICARRLFTSRDGRLAEAMTVVWEHSLAVALASRELATLAGADGEVAYLAGLLHDIGKSILGGLLLEVERELGESLSDASLALAVIQHSHRRVGVALATRWDLPAEVVAAIRDCGDYDSAERASIANFVRLANAFVKREGIYEDAVDPAEAQALLLVGRSLLGLDEDAVASACADLRDRLRAFA
jgi:putative nucleotidyltransferase with HDIG domain